MTIGDKGELRKLLLALADLPEKRRKEDDISAGAGLLNVERNQLVVKEAKCSDIDGKICGKEEDDELPTNDDIVEQECSKTASNVESTQKLEQLHSQVPASVAAPKKKRRRRNLK